MLIRDPATETVTNANREKCD